VAAVIAETVRSTPVIPPPGYWARVRAACDRHGALLILDEIPNGLGRTGRLFSCEGFGVVPDILVLGKGLGGGVMALSALIAREGLNVAGDRAIGHFTHENPCPARRVWRCSTARARLPGARHAWEMALGHLREMADRHPLVGEVGASACCSVSSWRGARSRQAVEQAEAVMCAALSRGLSFKVTMGVCPPRRR
jgi:4-aminobutyrate aminotransferase